MFSLNPTKDLTKIGEKVERRRVPTGHIFKYEDGNHVYGHLSYTPDYAWGMKFTNWSQPNQKPEATFTCTPRGSARLNSDRVVSIKGYFEFEVQMFETPVVGLLNELLPYDKKIIKDVISVRGQQATHNSKLSPNPLFLVLGKSEEAQGIVCLRLTGDIDSIGLIHVFNESSVIAHRGTTQIRCTVGV